MKYIVGVDAGGTFTDLVCIDEAGGTAIAKASSTPADPSLAVIKGLTKLGRDLGKRNLKEFLADVVRISHGTTVSTNTILTWTGAKVGLLTTQGFRDSLEIRFGMRENIYDYTIPQPKPMVPRYLRVPIEERLKWNGEEVTPLNEDEVRKAGKYLKEQGVDAIVVGFLFSFINPAHERRVVEILKEELPNMYIVGSCDIQPEIHEYWRLSTAVISAYVGPALSKYLTHLVDSLREAGFTGELLITQSNAGIISPDVAREQAVRTVMSGPACAPAAAAYLCTPLNINDLITIDMGGTSFDVCLIKGGAPWMTLEGTVAGVYHLRLPMVDIHTIGAGGGSIAWLDSLKVLHIGPQSAGAVPGPVCYATKGEEPTITDADLVLGYLNPKYFLGGEITLNIELARKAIKEKIADPLGMDVIEAARAIVAVADHNMADEISAVAARRGEDSRRYALVAAGGAGPLHAASLAKELSIRRILVPRTSSIFCALGSVIADIRHDFVKTVNVRSSVADFGMLMGAYSDMKGDGDAYLEKEGIAKEDRYYKLSMDLRYKGQIHEVEVPISESELTKGGMEQIVNRFHETHEASFGWRDIVDTDIANVRVGACGKVVTPAREEQPFVSKDSTKYIKMRRDVYIPEYGGFASIPIYDGDAMETGNEIEGPAIVEQKTTTIFVPSKARLEVTSYRDYMIDMSEES